MQYARMILEKRHPDLENVRQPMFVYVLTMKEHGRIGRIPTMCLIWMRPI